MNLPTSVPMCNRANSVEIQYCPLKGRSKCGMKNPYHKKTPKNTHSRLEKGGITHYFLFPEHQFNIILLLGPLNFYKTRSNHSL